MAADASASSVLLQGDVLQIGFHGVGKASYPEDIAAAAVLRAIAQHAKIDLRTGGIFWGDYCYFAGVTGEAFRFLEFMELWKGSPDQALVERYGHLGTAEMYRAGFEAAGLVAEFHMRPRLPKKDFLRRRVVESIRGRAAPVVGFGVFGPPEPFLITGFSEDGEVLLGWSHFQGEKKSDPAFSFEPSGQFRLRGWYELIGGIATVTGALPRPEPSEVYRSALERAIRELRTTEGNGGVLGTAAMESWATHLETEADYAGFTDSPWQKAHADHGQTAGDLAERRALASSFLELAARFLPEAAEDLERASAVFMGAHDTVYEIWEVAANTGPFDPDVAKFKDPARRRTMATLVRRLAAFDRRAIALLERAMNVVEGRRAGPAIGADPLLDGTVVLTRAETPTPPPSPWAPRYVAFPHAMGMLRAFLGEPFGELTEAEQSHPRLDCCLWMGFTGAAFGMPGDGAERSSFPLAFDALGYDYELWMSHPLAEETDLPCRQWGWDDNLRRRIFWNLRDRRLPVLLFGCGPWPGWWLVTRAERWGRFQGYGGSGGEHDRPIDLFEGMKGKETFTVNLIGRRIAPRPPMEDLYRRAVAGGARKMGAQKMRVFDASGTELISAQSYRDWARMMETDALFPAADPEALKARHEWLEGYEVELAERRHYGAGFLDLASARLGRPELAEAAARFRTINALMDKVRAHRGGKNGPEAHLRLAERNTREAIAALLLQVEREDLAAAALLGGDDGGRHP